jgi:hypothetical protein
MDLPVLKYVDVLIGLSLVMLLTATVALSISQAVLNLLRARKRHLARALERLILQVHPQRLELHAAHLANMVLLHPLVGLPSGPIAAFWDWLVRKVPGLSRLPRLTFGPSASGRVILREELAMCLLGWASDSGVGTMSSNVADKEKNEQARAALIAALRERGIEDPTATEAAVKMQAMANERDHPEQPAEVWRTQALAQCAPSEFLAGLCQSFDNAMARATTTFGQEAQVWVSLVALVLVCVAQLDAIQLVKRLSVDDVYRASLVKQAESLTAAIEKECGTAPTPSTVKPIPDAPAAGPATPPAADSAAAKPPRCSEDRIAAVVNRVNGMKCDDVTDAAAKEKCRIEGSLAILRSPALDIWPDGPTKVRKKETPTSEPGWMRRTLNSVISALTPQWAADLGDRFYYWRQEIWPKLPGIFVAWLLVSLGAPFWYDMLKNLFKLRSLLAQKDEADRADRNEGAKPPTATVKVTRPADSGGSGAGRDGGGGGGNPPAGQPALPAAAPDDHMGDLAATGAQG